MRIRRCAARPNSPLMPDQTDGGGTRVTVLARCLARQLTVCASAAEFALALRARTLVGREIGVDRLAQCQQSQVVEPVELEARVVRIALVAVAPGAPRSLWGEDTVHLPSAS